MDCVAITSGHDRRYTSAGKSDRWGELIGEASMQALRTAIQKALVPAGKNALPDLVHQSRNYQVANQNST